MECTLFCHLAVEQDIRYGHQKIAERRWNADNQHAGSNFFFYEKILGGNAERRITLQKIIDMAIWQWQALELLRRLP